MLACMQGIPKPSMMDGRSWLPIAQGQDPSSLQWRQDFLIEYGQMDDLAACLLAYLLA